MKLHNMIKIEVTMSNVLNWSDLRNTVLSQMQGNRGDHLSRDLPQVLVRAIYGLWEIKSCYYMLIMYMKRV